MCMSCGCKQPNENHGDDRNITIKDLEQAAEAAGTDVQGVMKNFQQDFQFAKTGTGRANGGQYSGENPRQ